MTLVDLTNPEMLKDLTTIEIVGGFIDLLNDYMCTDIDYRLETKSLVFTFKACVAGNEKKLLSLVFENATVSTLKGGGFDN